jgi:hypothetical protein
METSYYIEVQRINKLLFVVIMIFAGVIPIVSISIALFQNDVKMHTSRLSIEIILAYLLATVIILLFILLKLEIKVTHDGIYYRLFPFTPRFRKIPFSEIHSYFIRKYNPITEYGGWGIRFSMKKEGIAYTVSGTMGLQIYLNNGKKILIGTRQPDSLISVLNNLIPDKNITNKENKL